MNTESLQQGQIKVWDLFVRVFHWTLVAAFAVAYVTEDEAMALHVWAGYLVGGLVLARIIWGFVGPAHARFGDFVCGPFKAWRYLIDLILFRARRHVGHSPAGGAMVLVLMAGCLLTVWTGMELYAAEEGKGPLSWQAPVIAQALADDDDREGHDDNDGGEGDLHEWIAHLTFLAVLFHIAGVFLAGIVHKENLVRAMITGRKRPE
ncbi:MAG: cytochrome b/b6 domain-containing protein [Proteobacteria bacterium]|nr:cytochrome b/b6 domain-containing protein [Pseudomonadota bacterium]